MINLLDVLKWHLIFVSSFSNLCKKYEHKLIKVIIIYNNYNVLSEILILNGLNFIGNHEDKINRIVKLEDRIAELLNSAQQQKEEFTAEISNLKEKLKNAEGITSNVPSTTELQSKEDAYRKTIAEADSLLSKMETEYQTTIKVCNL